MATIIKVNGQTIKIEPKSVVSTESLLASIESIGNDIDKDIAQLNIIGNVQAMESFGYKATEAVMDKVKEVAGNVWTKIKEMFGKLVQFLQDMQKRIQEFISGLTKSGIDKNFNTMRVQRADFENVLKGASGETFNAKLTLNEADKLLDLVQIKTNKMHEISSKLNNMKLVEKLKTIATGGANSGGTVDVMVNAADNDIEPQLTEVNTFGGFMAGSSVNDLSAVARKNLSQYPMASKSVMASIGQIAAIQKGLAEFKAPEENDPMIKSIINSLSSSAKTISKMATMSLKYMNSLSCITSAEKFCIQYYNAHHEAPAAANA